MTVLASFLSAIWEAVAPALGDHLWQSTLFAIAAGVLTLALRKNHARTRYWLWLAASLKFLIPFSLFVGLGSQLAWLHKPAPTTAGLYVTMEQVSQPFTQPAAGAVMRTAPATVLPALMHLLPALFAVWVGGFLAVALVWSARWRRISSALHQADALHEGRELETLRRLERAVGLRRQVEIRSSAISLEPGIFGIMRPVLLWPRGISQHLDDAHLEAILAHELWHVRRRDNLAAALHMVVEAIFWFHPLVWWLGARLLDERERACDEAVLAAGSEKQVYAESILKTCEFCVGSPLACVSGVTGADLKGRIVRIMSEHAASKLNFGRKLLLSAAVILAFIIPIGFGLLGAAPSRAQAAADVSGGITPGYQATVKPDNSTNKMQMVRMMFSPDGFQAQGVPVKTIVQEAYGVQQDQIAGGPDWLNSQKYDFTATLDQSAIEALKNASEEQRRFALKRMLQSMLADRFKLTLHRETKDLPVYELAVAEGGAKLQQSKSSDSGGAKPQALMALGGHAVQGQQKFHMGNTELNATGLSMGDLAGMLSRNLGTPVLDKTGLTGRYDLSLHWTPNDSQLATFPGPGGGEPGTGAAAAPTSASPSLFNAVQEQLGLQLEPRTVPMETLVVDHVEQPSEN